MCTLNLIDSNFKKDNPLRSMMNRNFCKISYRTTQNFGQLIASYNAKLLRDSKNEPQRECNCRVISECPLNGKCLLKNLVYQATIEPKNLVNTNFKVETYIGLTSTTFKARLANHKASIKNRGLMASCKLAQHCWSLKDNKVDFNIRWKIICRAKTFSPINNVCNLCLNEKMFIVFFPSMASLNSRTELTTNCRHRSNVLIDKG